MKVNIKVSYKSKIDPQIDKKIISIMESINCKWYAQGQELQTNIRDICFDLTL